MTYFTNVVLGDFMVLLIVCMLVVCSYLLGKSAGVHIGYRKGKKESDGRKDLLMEMMNRFNTSVLYDNKLLLTEYLKLKGEK